MDIAVERRIDILDPLDHRTAWNIVAHPGDEAPFVQSVSKKTKSLDPFDFSLRWFSSRLVC